MSIGTVARRKPARKQLEAQCYAWNAKHPVGVFVNVRKDDDTVVRTTTRGEAFVDQGGTSAVIRVEGISGYYLLDRVTAEKRDGLDLPIDPAALYYVQDSRTIVGNCISWWCPDGAGYACNLADAGTYTGAKVLGMREHDIPWPAELVEASARRYVDWQILRHAAEAQGAPRRNVFPSVSP